ncbi:MAG TPA: ABC transporter permease, partial [Chloroflexia bacterium]|nr:ABC transporter permease [Chloroflexia bacterium]
RAGVAGLITLSSLISLSILVPIFAPYESGFPGVPALWDAPAGVVDPSGHVHLLGTIGGGADFLVVLLSALRTTLSIALPAAFTSVLLGFSLGALAGFYGGFIDALIMRLADLMLALPTVPAYIFFGIILRSSLLHFNAGDSDNETLRQYAFSVSLLTILLFTLFGWMGVSRYVRASILSLRQQPFVEAARALGASDGHIIMKHLLPNSIAPLIVSATFAVGDFIIALAILSYMDRAVAASQDLGALIVTAFSRGHLWYMSTLNPFEDMRGYTIILPCVMILLVVLSINYIGDALRYALDPHRHV